MSTREHESEPAEGAAGAAPGPPPVGPPPAPRRRLGLSFKLRFATQREPGRSDVSAIRPLGLPSPVAEKPGGGATAAGPQREAELAALARVRAQFARGPRERHLAPLTAQHEYGWWWDRASKMSDTTFGDPRFHHHIRDSHWLKSRLLVLAADDKLKKH